MLRVQNTTSCRHHLMAPPCSLICRSVLDRFEGSTFHIALRRIILISFSRTVQKNRRTLIKPCKKYLKTHFKNSFMGTALSLGPLWVPLRNVCSAMNRSKDPGCRSADARTTTLRSFFWGVITTGSSFICVFRFQLVLRCPLLTKSSRVCHYLLCGNRVVPIVPFHE